MKIGILAGEASGDLLGAKLIQALQKECDSLSIEGIGGPAMMANGCNSLFDIELLNVMGFVEPLRRLPQLIKLRSNLYQHFLKNKPDVFIGIDSPGFNLGFEYKLKQAGIPIVHYVSPSVWAWHQSRIYKIAKSVDLMLTLFPFEVDIYKKHHIPVQCVGHPLADQIPLVVDKSSARQKLCIDEQATYIAILPGSRRQELQYIGEPFLLAAEKIAKVYPHIRFLTSHVNEQRYDEFYEIYRQKTPNLPLTFFTRRSQDVMAAADFVLVTSGTATLETMLYKRPMVIAYRMSVLTYQLAKRLVKTKYIGLPNLLANESLVPELIQHEVNPERIAAHVLDLLAHPEKTLHLNQKFTRIHQDLLADAAKPLAKSILNIPITH